jgi:hypothetical protein
MPGNMNLPGTGPIKRRSPYTPAPPSQARRPDLPACKCYERLNVTLVRGSKRIAPNQKRKYLVRISAIEIDEGWRSAAVCCGVSTGATIGVQLHV